MMGRQNTRDNDNRSAQQRYETQAPYQTQAAPYQPPTHLAGPASLPDRRARGQHDNEPQYARDFPFLVSSVHNPIQMANDGPRRVHDVYIAVMGVTGAGKSTFISTCSGKKAKIGHSLQSCV